METNNSHRLWLCAEKWTPNETPQAATFCNDFNQAETLTSSNEPLPPIDQP
jgi:hypothetical protein